MFYPIFTFELGIMNIAVHPEQKLFISIFAFFGFSTTLGTRVGGNRLHVVGNSSNY